LNLKTRPSVVGFLIPEVTVSLQLMSPTAATLHVLGKGNKDRVISLPKPAQRMLRAYLATRPEAGPEAPLFVTAAGQRITHKVVTRVVRRIGQRLGRPGYQPAGTSDPIAHWMKYDSWRPPSRPHTTFPQTRRYGSSPDRPATTSRQSLQRHERSTLWFQLYRRGGRVILHHGHIRPVLIRDWSPKMDGIAATIWASRTTLPLEPRDRLNLAAL